MKKKDFLLVGAILGLSLILLLVYYLVTLQKQKELENADNVYVLVEVNGQEIARYGLDQTGEYSLNGGTNTLRIENGEAYLIDATCPDHLCVEQGKVLAGKPIICLPNKLTVTLIGVNDGVDF